MSAAHTSVHDPASRGPTLGVAFCSLLAGAMLVVALVLLLAPARASAQGSPVGCDYADPGSGPLAENICWIDFSGSGTTRLRSSSITLPNP